MRKAKVVLLTAMLVGTICVSGCSNAGSSNNTSQTVSTESNVTESSVVESSVEESSVVERSVTESSVVSVQESSKPEQITIDKNNFLDYFTVTGFVEDVNLETVGELDRAKGTLEIQVTPKQKLNCYSVSATVSFNVSAGGWVDSNVYNRQGQLPLNNPQNLTLSYDGTASRKVELVSFWAVGIDTSPVIKEPVISDASGSIELS